MQAKQSGQTDQSVQSAQSTELSQLLALTERPLTPQDSERINQAAQTILTTGAPPTANITTFWGASYQSHAPRF